MLCLRTSWQIHHPAIFSPARCYSTSNIISTQARFLLAIRKHVWTSIVSRTYHTSLGASIHLLTLLNHNDADFISNAFKDKRMQLLVILVISDDTRGRVAPIRVCLRTSRSCWYWQMPLIAIRMHTRRSTVARATCFWKRYNHQLDHSSQDQVLLHRCMHTQWNFSLHSARSFSSTCQRPCT